MYIIEGVLLNQDKPSYEELEAQIQLLHKSTSLVKSLQNEIKLNNSFLEILFDAIPSPIFYKNSDGIYLNCNDAFSKNILGISKKDIIGKSLYEFPNKIPLEHAKIYDEKDNELMNSKGIQFYATKVKCSDGKIRDYNFYKATFVSDDEALGIIGIMMDITDLKQKEEELKNLAFLDPLTNLFNRRYFIQSAKSIISLAKRENTDTTIMIIDIDDFKIINDVHGHENGDRVLIFVANTLKTQCRQSDLIARWGGEEFVILLPNTNLKGAKKVASSIKERIANENISMNYNTSIKITASMGLSEINNEDDNFEPALNKADKALYKAKNSGKNKIITV